MIDALLVYPHLGSMDSFVVDLPLSIIYAAADSFQRGYDIKLLDLRTIKTDWRIPLREHLDSGVRMIGLSVMTGMPLINARDVSRFVKSNYPNVKVVWGGPHMTVLHETIKEKFIDFSVRGYGSFALAELIGYLRGDGPDIIEIKGVSFKKNDTVVHNERSKHHEIIHYTNLPYHLLEVGNPSYSRSYLGELMFSMFSSIGCPYNCSFCVHPAIYKVINPPKWLPIPEKDVVDHMEFAINEFGVRNICFIDDTSFPNLERMRVIFQMILDRGLEVRLEFRGARINELHKMDDEFIQLMIKAGTRVLKVGAESASDRMLKLFNKQISAKQILEVSKKFARFHELTMDYNFFCGAPGESYDDLRITKDVVLQILEDNPNAYYSYGADWKPIPGSEMLRLAEEQYGFNSPKTFDEWAEMDSFDSKQKIVHPWYTKRHNNLIKLLQMAAFVLDDKVIKETAPNKSLPFRFVRLLARIYKPINKFRLQHNLDYFVLEYDIYRFALRVFPLIQKIFGSKPKKRASSQGQTRTS